ncbi:arylsulfatase [Jeotgalibaca sp. MA1X17-3]|uniref:arylsulfatase n=1 Tax=Jeotgalibaca sp. MA1X17-3 TaxID=2908211 RepID=UPI001EFF7314|nr:arylsulfatase [Jeotgalibaca sp. MA1X17-3]UJF15346.1 arylsulfatase [Jeotgalibaca sp. MA1X17-3]
MQKKRNVVLIMVDQLRFDCIGINGNSMISTPNLNMLAAEGYNFSNAYSATPTCIPARAALLTGLKQENHKRVGYEDDVPWDYEKTIASEFASKGYYTKAIGKMHVHPQRKLMGFHHIELHDGYLHASRKTSRPYGEQFQQTDDYLDWLKQKKGSHADLIDSGLDCNSWVARPWMIEEEYHPTNWLTSRAIDFLDKRDPTMPFFLKMSYVRPHSPLDPPRYYFDMYMDQIKDIPLSELGDWEKKQPYFKEEHSTVALRGLIPKADLKRSIAAYYGLVTHIDHQIGRFMMRLIEHDLDKDTLIVFLSDHGDQLGEHGLYRKGYPYQGSVHIPMMIYDPYQLVSTANGKTFDDLIEIRDVFPTLIELATGDKVAGIDGKSMVPIIKGDVGADTREYLHGEHQLGDYSSQFIITKQWKYIWYSVSGQEQLFHLETDPDECFNLIAEEKYKGVQQKLRDYLIQELSNREERFVKKGKLQTISHPINVLKEM